ncbi:hypothetical protein F5B17DRAFT_243175 [Nemania serpens]|nr:hypothetical protein F5B17DRAFT_243175 [Nemania serpens]
METINNMAVSAAKAVWGENKSTTQEPVSGRLGDTSKGEPYDAGNIEPTSANAGDAAPSNGSANGHVNNNTTEDSKSANGHVNGDTTGDAKFAKETGTAEESHDTPDNPSTNLKANSVPDDTSKAQNDTRSPEDPKTNPKSAPTDVNDEDDGPNEAPKLDGPGPKPLAEVAKENGGDAGNESTSSVDDKNKSEKDAKRDEEEKHESKGTGEQYVKTSGLQADGGDFDATKPGAGKEADRLLEEKGIHNPTETTPDTNSSSAGNDDSGSPTSGKRSLGQKIKDKLHRH